jgi:ubiquinone/menaquinone biosynthesis C-methylase UbiE
VRADDEMKRYRAIAEYYDHENERLAWLKRDVPFLLRHLPHKPQDVLELACGTGRVAIPLAEAGHRVVGVDYAADMLRLAREKRDALGVGERNLRLLHRDVLRLRLGRQFDWVVLMFNTFLSFTTLTRQDRALQIVRKHLKPGGRFWLDIFQPNLGLLANERSLGIDGSVFYVPSLDRTVYISVDVRRDPSKQLQEVRFNYTWFDKRGQPKRQHIRFDLTFIFPRELQLLLERNGLRIRKMWGNYDGSALGADSPRIIAMAQPA